MDAARLLCRKNYISGALALCMPATGTYVHIRDRNCEGIGTGVSRQLPPGDANEDEIAQFRREKISPWFLINSTFFEKAKLGRNLGQCIPSFFAFGLKILLLCRKFTRFIIYSYLIIHFLMR